MPAHHSVGAVKEYGVYLFAEAYLAHVLVVLFFNFQDLCELSNLLLQALHFLLHRRLLCRRRVLVRGVFSTIRATKDLRLV